MFDSIGILAFWIQNNFGIKEHKIRKAELITDTTRGRFQKCFDKESEHVETLISYHKGTPIENLTFFKNNLYLINTQICIWFEVNKKNKSPTFYLILKLQMYTGQELM